MKHSCKCPDCRGTRLNPCREDCECEIGQIDTGGFDPQGNPIFTACPTCIGREWLANSSLEKWFPLTAEELKQAKSDRDEWLWACSVVSGILAGMPGWEGAIETHPDGSPFEAIKTAKLWRRCMERIANYPIHSEPVGGAYHMADIAADCLKGKECR